MRITTAGLIVAFMGVACTPVDRSAPPPGPPVAAPRTAPSPYTEIVSGSVTALVPRNWQTMPAPTVDGIRGGFFASPHPRAWDRMDGSVAGMAATWVDATKVGVPSDYYYLAATGPLLDRLTDGGGCRAVHNQIFANHRPGFDGTRGPSPGDYIARADGRCSGAGASTRWASFVAAPGFGPAHEVGIPGSGLYVVVAVLRATEGAGSKLNHLVRHTAFGGTTVPELVGAVTGRYPVPS
ncbi:MAG: hypothetical protein QOI60_817 [Actinomycetota bacterium]|jgi:hypothetical protein|nr:hypothetical protein [Actinomycetota bacterium]